MKSNTYAIYPPAMPGLPFLAVVLEDRRLVATFSCEDETSASKVLSRLRARNDGAGSVARAAGEWPSRRSD